MSDRHCKDEVERKSFDILGENIEMLKQMFPECASEGKIDFDKLKTILGSSVDSNSERYTFSWAGKKDSISILNTRTDSTLKPCESESVDFDKTGNLFIEGDNLEVLKLLYKSYFGKIKMIYIDPPYNTGNDFIYKDDYSQPINQYLKLTGQKDDEGNVLVSLPETHGRRHSDWLSMMYPRLFVAKQLLTDDGVIFVSIDDNEVHHLRMLMNEIFGEENFISEIPWRGRGGGADNKYLMVAHEYILLYAKIKDQFVVGEENKEINGYNKLEENTGKKYKLSLARKWGSNSRRIDRPNLYYPVTAPDNTIVFPLLPTGEDGCWRFSNKRMKAEIDEGLIEFKKDNNNNWIVYEKEYEPDENESITKKISTWFENVGSYANGSNEIKMLFDNKVFTFPKPTTLIKKLIEVSDTNCPKDVVLDFFAGSCTTAHAVMELNRQDGGNRKFICVQLPEACKETSEAFKAGFTTIADIGKERIRRVIQKMKSESESKLGLEGNEMDLGFRAFRLDQTNYKIWNTDIPNPKDVLEQTALTIDPLAHGWEKSPENIIWEVALKEGYSLSSSIKVVENVTTNKVYKVSDDENGQHFYICLDDTFDMATIRKLNLSKSENEIGTLFVCRDNSLTDEMAVNINLLCRLKTL